MKKMSMYFNGNTMIARNFTDEYYVLSNFCSDKFEKFVFTDSINQLSYVSNVNNNKNSFAVSYILGTVKEVVLLLQKLETYVNLFIESIQKYNEKDYKKALYYRFKHKSFLAFASNSLEQQQQEQQQQQQQQQQPKQSMNFEVSLDDNSNDIETSSSSSSSSSSDNHPPPSLTRPPQFPFPSSSSPSISPPPPASIILQEEALEVWIEMNALGFQGYGRGLDYSDPYAEVIDILSNLVDYYYVTSCFDPQQQGSNKNIFYSSSCNIKLLRFYKIFLNFGEKYVNKNTNLPTSMEKFNQKVLNLHNQTNIENVINSLSRSSSSLHSNLGIDITYKVKKRKKKT
jgi:hypothetical protein